MNLVNWTPFRSMDGFFDQYQRMLGNRDLARADEGFIPKEFDWRPTADISETDKEYLIKAVLPDVEKDNIDIAIENGILTISGERRYEKDEESETQHRIESMYGKFARSFSLPADVDESKIKARTRNGTLTVRIPKIEKSKPAPVQISVE